MSLRASQPALWPSVGAAAVVAGLAGFGLAKLSSKPAAPPAASSAPATDATTVTVPAANLAVMQIAVEPVATGDLAADIQAPGTVAPEPAGEALVTAQAAGAVLKVNKRLGDPVKAGEVPGPGGQPRRRRHGRRPQGGRGQGRPGARRPGPRAEPLRPARDSPPDLETAQAAAAAADAEAGRARTAAATAHVAADGRSLAVVSPISGRITAEAASLGAYVQPETELFRVADPRRVQIEVALSAADAARVHPGDPARVTDASGASLAATVRSVTPTLSAETRSATAVLTLVEGARPPTPGEAVHVQLSPKGARGGGVVVPDEAVQSVGGKDVVFVRTPTGFKAQAVTVGVRSGGRSAILSGLQPGQSIATRNAFLLKAELTKGAGEDEE